MRSILRAEFLLFLVVAALILVGSLRLRVYYRVTVVETTAAPAAAGLPERIRTAGFLDRSGEQAIPLTQRRIDQLIAERPELGDRVWMLRLRPNGRGPWTESRYSPRTAR